MKLHGTPLPLTAGGYRFITRYGCHGSLWFWPADPGDVGKPGWEEAKAEVVRICKKRGDLHVTYFGNSAPVRDRIG